MYRDVTMTCPENRSFSGVYIITDNFSEHAYMTCVYAFVMTGLCYFCMYLIDSCFCVLIVDGYSYTHVQCM